MDSTKTLLCEENIISLRTAYILDDGRFVSLILMPKLDTSLPTVSDNRKSDFTILYRRENSIVARMLDLKSKVAIAESTGAVGRILKKSMRRILFGSPSIEKDIRPMGFENSPEIKLLWTESGHSVAVFLNGEPWAFIHEDKNHGYSKGVLKTTVGNPWSQALFEKTFC